MAGASSAGPGPRDDEHRQVGRGEAAAAAVAQRPGALRRAQSVAAEEQEHRHNHRADGQPGRPEGHRRVARSSCCCCYLDNEEEDRCAPTFVVYWYARGLEEW